MTAPVRINSLSVFILLTSFSSALTAELDVSMEEAENQWRILEKAGSQLECSYTLTRKYQKLETITKSKVLIGGRDHLWIHTKELKKQDFKKPCIEKVVGKNPNYAFRLSRQDGAPEYAIDYIGPSEGGLEKILAGTIAGHSGIPWSFSMNLSNLVKEPGFQLEKITRAQRNGKDIIIMIARYTPSSDGEKQTMTDINIILDPNRYWCILSFSFRVSWGRVVGSVEYGPDDHGFPVPVRYEMTQNYDKGGQTVFETVFGHWKYRRDGIPKKEFYLSAFGLPEPMGVKSLPSSRTWMWLLGATVAATLLAILFAWLKRRRTTASLRSPPSS